MRATVITHLIPDVYAWLQHSKACISRTAIAFCAKWTTPQITQHIAQYLVSGDFLSQRHFTIQRLGRTSASRECKIKGTGTVPRRSTAPRKGLMRLARAALRQIYPKQNKRRPQKQIPRRILAE
jgi:hypothetical protein